MRRESPMEYDPNRPLTISFDAVPAFAVHDDARQLRRLIRAYGLCAAEGDEGDRFCAEPRERHCEITGADATVQHLTECMKSHRPNPGPLHHVFVEA